MCMGLVKVEAGGNYKLSLVTDDGGGLAVDGIDVLEEDGEVDPFVTTCDSMKLLPGFHEVTIRWFNNGVQGNAARPAGLCKNALPHSMLRDTHMRQPAHHWH